MVSGRERANVRCSLRIGFPSREEAERANAAIELDNEGYVSTRVEGGAILAEIEADSLSSLLHTLDDLLSCTAVAEKLVSRKR